MAVSETESNVAGGSLVAFESFVSEVEPRVRRALSVAYGIDRGGEASADAFLYAWEHWQRISDMVNPAGYVYTVGRSRARRRRQRPPVFPDVPFEMSDWVEPGLPKALAKLSEMQRVSVWLVHGFEWSPAEASEILGISLSSLRTHLARGEKKLQRALGVGS